jgi:opacity protein-like surface antigen
MNRYLAASCLLLCLMAGVAHGQKRQKSGRDPLEVRPDSSGVNDHRNRWAFGLNGGYSYRLPNAGTRSDTPYSKYLKALKSGFSLGADVHHFVWPHVGLGLKYNIYKSKSEFNPANRDDITIQFVGPSVVYQSPLGQSKTSILAGYAMGYQSYKNNARAAGQNYSLKGNAIGWALSLGLEQKLSNHFALNLSGACYLGTSYEFKKESAGRTQTIKLSKENFENLSRAELTLGLKFLQ